MSSESNFNDGLVEEFRKNNGQLSGQFATRKIAVLTTTGAKSGLARTHPLVYFTDGGDVFVIGSNAGRTKHPDWYHNLLANPAATVELPGDTFNATAHVTEGAERERLYALAIEQMPEFSRSRDTPRQFPVVVLKRAN